MQAFTMQADSNNCLLNRYELARIVSSWSEAISVDTTAVHATNEKDKEFYKAHR